MKKIVFTLALIASVANAGLFDFGSKDADAPMLQASAYKTFQNLIGKQPIMIEFGSTHCHSCQMMGRTLYKIKQDHPKAAIFFVDIQQDKHAAQQYGIRVIPTQKFLDKDGKVVDTHMGLIEREILEKKLKEMGIL